MKDQYVGNGYIDAGASKFLLDCWSHRAAASASGEGTASADAIVPPPPTSMPLAPSGAAEVAPSAAPSVRMGPSAGHEWTRDVAAGAADARRHCGGGGEGGSVGDGGGGGGGGGGSGALPAAPRIKFGAQFSGLRTHDTVPPPGVAVARAAGGDWPVEVVFTDGEVVGCDFVVRIRVCVRVLARLSWSACTCARMSGAIARDTRFQRRG